MKIIDIARPIHEGMTTYPGTAETKITEVKSGSGSSVVSEVFMTTHAGTHIDAPSHSVPGAHSIDQFDLQRFYGPCRLVATGDATSITKAFLETLEIKPQERILFKTTNSARGFDTFYDNYVYIEPEAASYLADCGVGLVGVDALSVKQRGAPDNTSHTALLKENIAIIEGLNFAEVEAGEYTLCALPLKLKGLDGSPTRAVLIQN